MDRFAAFSQDEERLFVWSLHAALARVRSSDPRIFDYRQSTKINGQRGDRRLWLHVRDDLRQAPIQIRKRNQAELAEPRGCFLRIEVLGSDALTSGKMRKPGAQGGTGGPTCPLPAGYLVLVFGFVIFFLFW